MLVTDGRSAVIIQDELTLTTSSKVLWMGHMEKNAQYEISADKQTAIITVDGVSMVCTIVVPEGATYKPEFYVMGASYLPETGLKTQAGEYDRSDYMKLIVTTSGVTDYKLAVVCQLYTDDLYEYEFTPMDEWDEFID